MRMIITRSILRQMFADVRRRREVLANRLQKRPVDVVEVKFIGEGEELPGALTPEGRPINDPRVGDDGVAGDPPRRLQYVKCTRQMEDIFRFIAHKQAAGYRNRFGVQLNSAGGEA